MKEKENIRKAIELLIDYTSRCDCQECVLRNNCCSFFDLCPSLWVGTDESVKKFLTNEP